MAKKMVSKRARNRRAGAATAAGAFALSALGGCTVGPDYEAPKVEAPAAWTKDAGDTSDKAKSEPAKAGAWWTMFGDDELTSLIERARAGNTDLRVAVERLREARAQRGVVAASLWPQVNAEGSYSNSRFSENGFLEGLPTGGTGGGGLPGAIFPGQQINLYQADLDASWEIDLFGGQRRAVEGAEADIAAQFFSLADVQLSVLAEVADGYMQVRGLQARLAIAQRTAKLEHETVDIVREQAGVGAASELDLSRAQTLDAQLSARVPGLEASLKVAVRRLETLLGVMPGTLDAELETSRPVPASPDALDAGIPSDVLRRRPDVRAAERRIAAANARIGAATADLFPRFTLTGQFGLQSQEIGDLPEGDSRFWAIGPAVRWPILDFGRIRSNIDVQDARTKAATAMYEGTVVRALSDVESALVRLSREKRRLVELTKAADAAEHSVALAEDLYRNGVLEFLDLLDTQRQRDDAADAAAQSREAIASDTVALLKALGGGWGAMPADAGAKEVAGEKLEVVAPRQP